MATLRIPEQSRTLSDAAEIVAFLRPFGMTYERWPLEERVSPDASSDQILAAYAPEIDELKRRGGYVTADVINVTPDTPGLDALLNKFNKEHRHSEDEVRFIIKGQGLFHIHPDDGPVFSITVQAGDLITVPRGTRHWFDLCAERTIRAIRLFQDVAGWTPEYVDGGVHGDYVPMCWGPSYLPPRTLAPAVPR
ncbi:MAG: Acireductone dioxygenase [Phycisphaerae bacterium]|nr:Acireductone dioxygenase [Phycisphaerae bacterium]